MKPRRRTILRVIALLLAWGAAGAALNVAVAWGLAFIRVDHAVREEYAYFLSDQYGGPRVWTNSAERPWAVRHVFQFDGHRPFKVSEKDRARFPSWSRGATPRQIDTMKPIVPHEPMNHVLVEDARGWPLLSLHCEHVIAYATDKHSLYVRGIRGGIAINTGSSAPTPLGMIEIRSRILSSTALPLRPLWPGFAINTVFYAGVLWMLLCGPFALRRMIRRRRGRCAQCAYPIGQNERCTECGAAVTIRTQHV